MLSAVHAELRAIARITIPMWLTQLLQMGHGLVDTIMAGHLGTQAMAVVAIGSGLWLPILLFVQGVLMAAMPLSAHARGSKDWVHVSTIVKHGLAIALMLSVLVVVFLSQLHHLFNWAHVQGNMAFAVNQYLHGLMYGAPGIACFIALRTYSESLGQVIPVTVISLITLLLNIPLNYLFMHGGYVVPAMGGPGCGYATACVYWLAFLCLLVWISVSQDYEHARWHTGVRGIKRLLLQQFLKLGFPIGAALFFEVSAFALIAVILAPLGAVAVAGHQVALSIASFLFMLPLALSNALTLRTGHILGAGDWHGMDTLLRISVPVTLGVSIFNALLVLSCHTELPKAYSTDLDVQKLATHLLLYTAAFQVFDGIQVCMTGILRGLHDTRGPFWITLLSYWMITLPLGYSLGLTSLWGSMYGPSGLWMALVLGLFTAALLLGLRLRHQLKHILPDLRRKHTAAQVFSNL